MSAEKNLSNLSLPVLALPAGAEIKWHVMHDGWKIRTALWLPPAARYAVVLVGGRSDFIEKYAELIGDLLAHNFAVATFDWRGQGLSGRMTVEPFRSHLSSFDDLKKDLIQVVDDIFVPHLQARTGNSVNVLAHSMGGLVTLLALHDCPRLFKRAVLLAPMCGIKTKPVPVSLARYWAKSAVDANQGQHFAFGQKAYGPDYSSKWRQLRLTSDIERYAMDARMIEANPALAMGGVSYGWLNAAFEAFETMKTPGFAEVITLPTRIFLSEYEKIVDNQATERIARRLLNCRISIVSGACHEIYRERDVIRSPVLTEVFAWLKS